MVCKRAEISLTDRQVAPTITEVTSPSPTSVSVTWTITSNVNLIRSFVIEIRLSSSTPGEENSWTSVEQRNPNRATQLEIDDLTPFTSYDVRVSAVYVSGTSEAVIGEAVMVVTMEDLPGGPPKEVTIAAVPTSDTDIEIKWQVCLISGASMVQ